MTDFALGDIVVMKMGGPWMTVVDYGYEEPPYVTLILSQPIAWYTCIWFDDSHRLQRDKIDAFALKPVELVA